MRTPQRFRFFVILLFLSFGFVSTGFAQYGEKEKAEQQQAQPQKALPPTDAPTQNIASDEPSGIVGVAPEPTAAPDLQKNLRVQIQVQHGSDSTSSLSNLPVLLQAARPRGPFEPTAPAPEMELTAITNSEGVAVFDNVPESLITRGLRIHAIVHYEGISFASTPITPSASAKINLKVYEKGHDPSGITVTNLRTIVEPWEDYMIFTQFWTLSVNGPNAIDVSLLSDPKFERGLPLKLPTKAQGIHVSGAGEASVVNSIVFWQGVLVPQQAVTFQVRFSMSVHSSEFVYEQTMDYPTDNIEVIAPLQTQYAKVPRLDNLEIVAPGFEVSAGAGLGGLRSDMEFLTAVGKKAQPGESFKFALRGLPFDPPIGPWIALILGVLAGAFVFIYARREYVLMHGPTATRDALEALAEQRDILFDELTTLEAAYRAGDLDDSHYETRSWLLRERLALILKKTQDLEDVAAA